MDVLVIRGAFAPPEQLVHLPAHMPGIRIDFRDLPTDRPRSIRDLAAEVDADIARPTLIVGVSLGGLVALALRSPLVRGVLALDPPLVTSEMPQWLRDGLATFDAEPFLRSTFGFGLVPEGRDYRELLTDAPRPLTIIAGAAPGTLERSGAISDETLASIPSWARVIRISDVGHNIAQGGGLRIIEALKEALAAQLHHDQQDAASCA